MFGSRKEYYECFLDLYRELFERNAKLWQSGRTDTVTDIVGYDCTRMEEQLRPLWGIAPFLGDDRLTVSYDGKEMSAADYITLVMLEGTQDSSEKRFDRFVRPYNEIEFANQAITEIAAYLVAVRLSRAELWDGLSENIKNTIALWIKKWSLFALRNSWRNNHLWYPVLCIEILGMLGYDCSEADAEMRAAYDFLDSLYCGHGFYSDGASGRFDYYEAWAHHTYTQLWVLIADRNRPGFTERADKYKKRTSEFLGFYSHYFDTDGGMAAYGRSVVYRFAAAAPFGLAVLAGCDIDPGLARRIILKNTAYFFDNRVNSEGFAFPVGYLYETSGFADNYSSSGSAANYTETLLCLLADEDHPLWKSPVKPLPSETGRFLVEFPVPESSFAVAFDEKNGVTLYNSGIHYYQDECFCHGFNDMAGSYGKFAYNSRSGYSLSTADSVAFDNMISLSTTDNRMASSRKRISGSRKRNGVFFSYHIPFSNDQGTRIDTAIVPLEDGWHVRVHKIVVTQPYVVIEGGYSVGITSDDFFCSNGSVRFSKRISRIVAYPEKDVSYETVRLHPGMHLLCPQALCPVWSCRLLSPGEYCFASAVCFTTDGKAENEPEITPVVNGFAIKQGNFEKEVVFD